MCTCKTCKWRKLEQERKWRGDNWIYIKDVYFSVCYNAQNENGSCVGYCIYVFDNGSCSGYELKE